MEWTKCKVVMLPAYESRLALYNNILVDKGDYATSYKEDDVIKPQHIYFLSDEDFDDGDLVMFDTDSDYLDFKPTVGRFENSIFSKKEFKYTKKIIATTDKTLMVYEPEVLARASGFASYSDGISLPEQPDDFIDKFIEAYNSGNVIKEVFVKIEIDNTWCGIDPNGEPQIVMNVIIKN